MQLVSIGKRNGLTWDCKEEGTQKIEGNRENNTKANMPQHSKNSIFLLINSIYYCTRSIRTSSLTSKQRT